MNALIDYASAGVVRQIRGKCAWLAFFWTIAAVMNLAQVGEHLLHRSWWWAALYVAFMVLTSGLAVQQVREWVQWDRRLGGTQ